VAFQQLDERFKRLKLPAKAGDGFDADLAEQWNDAAGARMFALYLKQEELSEDERAEYTQLRACARAWQHLHTPPHEWASRDPTIADADRGRAWELRLRPFIWDAPPLTEEERRELAGLDARLGAERDAIETAKQRSGGAARRRTAE